jgi:hypothetical protein
MTVHAMAGVLSGATCPLRLVLNVLAVVGIGFLK